MCPSLPATVSLPHHLLDGCCLHVHEAVLMLTAEHCDRQSKALLLYMFTKMGEESLQYACTTCGITWQVRRTDLQA